MSLPDEYDSWRCENCNGKDCKAEFMHCDDCDDGKLPDGSECTMCSGSGGAHVCIRELQSPPEDISK